MASVIEPESNSWAGRSGPFQAL